MPGLIQNELDGTSTAKTLGQKVATANTTNYDPALRRVDAAKETVSGQLDNLLKSDSSYITRARSSADQVANRRGLLNSSMAAGAGEAAAIDAALPIAQGDAGVYDAAARDNMNARNTAFQFNAGETNQNARVNAGAKNDITKMGYGASLEQNLVKTKAAQDRKNIAAQGQQTRMTQAQANRAESQQIKLRGNIDKAMQSLKGTQAKQLANIEANYRSLIQANSSAASMFGDTAKMIAAINVDSTLTPEAKTAAVQKQMQLLNASMSVFGAVANIDLSNLLTFD